MVRSPAKFPRRRRRPRGLQPLSGRLRGARDRCRGRFRSWSWGRDKPSTSSRH